MAAGCTGDGGATAPCVSLASARQREGIPGMPLPLHADTDLAYTAKPLWPSYLRFLEDGGADAAMAFEVTEGVEAGKAGTLL